MAKTQKYSEDKLLEAVVKFSEIEKKKIKATELAKWCRDNIEGLEEVRDYHFTRSVKEKDERTGKMVERPKRCTLKIEEINKSRSLIVSIIVFIFIKDIGVVLVVSLSLFINMIVGAMIGAFMPVLLKRLDVDPSIISAPLISTILDITGVTVYFVITSFVLSKIV